MAESLKTILMSALTSKATPAGSDTLIVGEGNTLKKISFSQLFTYLKDKLGINTLNSKTTVIQGAITGTNSSYPIESYQLCKIGSLVVFNVTSYKKGTGRFTNRTVCNIPGGFRPKNKISIPFSTTGAVTDTSSNPGSTVYILNNGAVIMNSNYDTGNYASWSACWII